MDSGDLSMILCYVYGDLRKGESCGINGRKSRNKINEKYGIKKEKTTELH